MRMAMQLVAAICVLLLGAGCSTNRLNLKYESGAEHPVISSKSGISVGRFADARGESPTWFGAIRGGFGNPIKVMETDIPVSTVVANAFTSGLQERKALATSTES